MLTIHLHYKYLVSIYISLGLVDNKALMDVRAFIFSKDFFRSFQASLVGYSAYPLLKSHRGNLKTWGQC
jgi:hypothetical protein